MTYVGKPYPAVYATCRALLGDGKLLAVGDNPATDIRGANAAGIDSLLIGGGILKVSLGHVPGEEEARGLCLAAGADPTYVLASFALGE
ncbi:MAG: HAD hydrolase-like protein [Alphaproteobacteria bacterium]